MVPKPILRILHLLECSGHKAFIVGGAIRDMFLQAQIKDWDLTTNAPEETIMDLFPKAKLVGESFGVFLIPTSIGEIELARFRTEGAYSDSRHPDKVEFTSDIVEDLKRRDFTVNAFTWNLKGKIRGVKFSREDLENKLVRAIGNPETRFTEDPVRILRAFRMVSEKSFTIEWVTAGACMRLAPLLAHVAPERIFSEFIRILNGSNAVKALELMRDLRVLEEIMPEVKDTFFCGQNRWHDMDVFTHMINTLPNLPSGWIKLAGFFHDIGKPASMFFDADGTAHFYGKLRGQTTHDKSSAKLTEQVLRRWNCSNEEITRVCTLVRNHMHPFLHRPNPKKARKLLRLIDRDLAFKQIELLRADIMSRGTCPIGVDLQIQELVKVLQTEIDEQNAVKITDLAISGNDLMDTFNLKPSRQIGSILQKCLDKVIDDPECNTKEFLLEFAKGLKEREVPNA